MNDEWADDWPDSAWPSAAWGQQLVAQLVNERDLALARRNRLTGEPILPPRFPPLLRRVCSRCGRRSGKDHCPRSPDRHDGDRQLVKHVLKPTCRHGCRFLQMSDELWLCPHASYGQLTHMKGAVEEARRLLELQGGYQAVLDKIISAEDARKKQKRADEAEGRKRIQAAVRYE